MNTKNSRDDMRYLPITRNQISLVRYWGGSRVFEGFTFLGRYVETDTSNIKVLQVQAQRQKKTE